MGSAYRYSFYLYDVGGLQKRAWGARGKNLQSDPPIPITGIMAWAQQPNIEMVGHPELGTCHCIRPVSTSVCVSVSRAICTHYSRQQDRPSDDAQVSRGRQRADSLKVAG